MVLALSHIIIYSNLTMKQDHSTNSYQFCVFINSFILKCYAQVETISQLVEIFFLGGG